MLRFLLLLSASCLFAQRPQFETAEIYLSANPAGQHSIQFTPGGQLIARNVTISEFLPLALNKRPGAITGSPAWFSSERLDIVAKAPSKSSEADLGLMLLTLLEKELKLVVREETGLKDGYALVVLKGPGELHPAATPGPTLCKRGADTVDCTNITMSELAERLPLWAPKEIERTVVDQTGLTGSWNLKLEWTPLERTEQGGGLTIFDAVMKQLGLRLESRKLPLPVTVIVSAERPR